MRKLKIFLFVLLMMTVPVTPVFADYYHPHNGGYYGPNSNTYTRASATIKTPTYPWTYLPSFSSCYTMLADSNATSWVQTGWTKNNGQGGQSGVWYFFQVADYPNNPVTVFGTTGPAENSTHTYRTYASGSNWVGDVDSVQIYSTGKNWDGRYYEFDEEIANYNAAFAGYNSNRARFSNVSVIKNGSNVYGPSMYFKSDTDGALDTSKYLNGYYFDAWDTRY